MSAAVEIVSKAPEVGRYEGIDENIYHREWEACSASRLLHMARSAAYCRYAIDNPTDPTPAMIFGSAVHCLVLQPDEFAAHYEPPPPCPEGQNPKGWPNTKKYKEIKAGIEERGLAMLTVQQWDEAYRIFESLRATPSAALDLLNAATGTEVSYVVDDPTTGVRCKVRTDLEVESAGIIADLKTTQSAASREFERSVHNFNYHARHAFYEDRLDLFAPGKWKHHVLIAVESSEPFEHRLYEIEPAAVEMGRRKMNRLLAAYAKCEKSGEWPGHPDGIRSISVPHWAFTQEEFEDND